MALRCWGEHMRGRTVAFITDSEAAFHLRHKRSSRDPAVAALLRSFYLLALRLNVIVLHVWQRRSSPAMRLADLISRGYLHVTQRARAEYDLADAADTIDPRLLRR